MKKLIIPTIMDTYGLIKFWDFDNGGPEQQTTFACKSKYTGIPWSKNNIEFSSSGALCFDKFECYDIRKATKFKFSVII